MVSNCCHFLALVWRIHFHTSLSEIINCAHRSIYCFDVSPEPHPCRAMAEGCVADGFWACYVEAGESFKKPSRYGLGGKIVVVCAFYLQQCFLGKLAPKLAPKGAAGACTSGWLGGQDSNDSPAMTFQEVNTPILWAEACPQDNAFV